MQSVEIRRELVGALQLDLVGPSEGSPLEREVLSQAPSRWYLTGFLAPLEASPEQRSDETAAEEVDELEQTETPGDDNNVPERSAAKRAYFPSSMGMSLLLPGSCETLDVSVRWGDYVPHSDGAVVLGAGTVGASEEDGGQGGGRIDRRTWQRTQRKERVTVPLPAKPGPAREVDVPNSNGLKLAISTRPVPVAAGMPKGTRSVSVFLVNRRTPAEDESRDQAFVFQAELEVRLEESLVPRMNLRGLDTKDWDERVADLQYRDACEYAVGHNVATEAKKDSQGNCRNVRTCWIPTAEVERVESAQLDGVELSMEALSGLQDGADAHAKLGAIPSQYRAWIAAQSAMPQSHPLRKKTADELMNRAGAVANRIESGIQALQDPMTLEAFRIANRVMAAAARQRFGVIQDIAPNAVVAPTWRPFQLAFILMNLDGLRDPLHTDREWVDLLFFPTGGGKTEAYLGLAAFTLVLRRLRDPNVTSAGLSVLMRYTLRLLTLDQLGRAATLICALELERKKDPARLGDWPFEIGLWVGRAATPNKMGNSKDHDPNTARARTIAYKNNSDKPSPIPLETCPWCGTRFTQNSFQLVPGPDNPIDLRIVCMNRNCAFTRGNPLPILTVDEPIYRRLPCFLIATVDKFAAMPWTGQVGAFFGGVERCDKNGFYGPCDLGGGSKLPKPLPPPDLVIQDELHLISGPLGTLVGLYETALDALCSRQVDGKRIRPKIVASTATVRRAPRQVQSLFGRPMVEIFPPPGPDRRDSFFAITRSPEEANARQYVGIAAQGRSLKVVLLRTYLALLGAAQKAYEAEGGKKNKNNPTDPYMTLLGYFNSLRELGGSRRIIEDEVGTRLTGYSQRKRVGESKGLFADRRIAYEVVELTSRVSTDEVAEAKRKLALPFPEKGCVDVAIATNMISVGLDITRLGLMVVLGQPKTAAEYIQATSRVGREVTLPGLVVTLLNVHRPRDRSHYERFAAYHETFYRSVEATSVTPFAPRALDRGLAGTAIALARLGHQAMTAPLGAASILTERTPLDFVVDAIGDRAYDMPLEDAAAKQELKLKVCDRVKDLLDTWNQLAYDYNQNGTRLQYQWEAGGATRLLYDFVDPEIRLVDHRHRKFRANRSMRDVEPNVNLWVKTLDNVELGEDE